MTLKNIQYIIFILAIFVSLPFTAGAQLQMPTFNNDGIEARVRELFMDAPVMVDVARCESGFRQFAPSGQPLSGGRGANIGVFQINEASHASWSKSLGYDIYSTEGNLAYARYLYDRQGTKPWVSCVPASQAGTPSTPTSPISPITPVSSPTPASPPPTTPITGTLTANLSIGMVHAEARVLQQMLNGMGFAVASSGPGSPGNETTMFGQLTRAALQRFQCAKNIVCEGSESTTGFGRLGPRTRAALVQIQK